MNELAISLSEHHRFNQEKSNGDSWLPHATAEWVRSRKHSRSMKKYIKMSHAMLNVTKI